MLLRQVSVRDAVDKQLRMWSRRCPATWLIAVSESSVEDKPAFIIDRILCEGLQATADTQLMNTQHQICDENRRLTPNNTLDFMRLYRSAWCLAELLEDCADAPSSDDVSLVAERLIVLFAELGDNNSNAAAKGMLPVKLIADQ